MNVFEMKVAIARWKLQTAHIFANPIGNCFALGEEGGFGDFEIITHIFSVNFSHCRSSRKID